MRKLFVAVLVTALAGVLAATALAATRTVKVGDNYFIKNNTKPTITVKKGTKVTWKWAGKALHDVHANSGPAKFKSKLMSSGSYSRTLKAKGTYKLLCDVHPSQMRMTIKVN
jgi:plastocyanin